MKKNILFAVIAIMLVAGAFLYKYQRYTPSLDHTGWIAYSDPEFDVHFSYPGSSRIVHETIPESMGAHYTRVTLTHEDKSVNELLADDPLQEPIEYQKFYDREYLIALTTVNMSIAGNTWERLVDRSWVYYTLTHNDIEYSYRTTKGDEKLAREILSTVTFEDPIRPSKFSIPMDTSDWLTYRDNKLGFEFKYPAGHTVSEGLNPEGTALDPAEEGDSIEIVEFEEKLFGPDRSPTNYLWIAVNKKIPNASLKGIARDVASSLSDYDIEYREINGMKAAEITEVGINYIGQRTVVIDLGDSFALINSDQSKMFDAIINSIKAIR